MCRAGGRDVYVVISRNDDERSSYEHTTRATIEPANVCRRCIILRARSRFLYKVVATGAPPAPASPPRKAFCVIRRSGTSRSSFSFKLLADASLFPGLRSGPRLLLFCSPLMNPPRITGPAWSCKLLIVQAIHLREAENGLVLEERSGEAARASGATSACNMHGTQGKVGLPKGCTHLSVDVSHKHLDASLTPCPRFCPTVTCGAQKI